MEHEHVDFKEAVTIGAKKLNLDFEWPKERNFNQEEYNKKEAILIVLQRAAEYFQEAITKNLVASEYLTARHFKIDDEDPFQIGYAPKGNNLLAWARKESISQELLVAAGLIGVNERKEPYDFFRERIVFPICDKNGRVIAFSGRYIGNNSEAAKKSKYLN